MKREGFTAINIVMVVAVVIALGGSLFWYHNQSSLPQQIGCTEETRQCADGSYVGRVGPRCEFAECPGGAILGDGNAATFSESVSLKVEQEVQIGKAGFSIKLISVHDSRCPLGVQCIWAGTVIATIELFQHGVRLAASEVALYKQVSLGGYSVEFSYVVPQEHLTGLAISDYLLIFTIEN